MFSNLMIGALAGLGAGGWIYAKLQRSTGGNTSSSLTAAGLCGLLICVVVTTALGFVS